MPARNAMPVGKAEYVGQILAAAIAETRNQALDAAEKSLFRDLNPVIDVESATYDGAPVVDPAFPDNICFRITMGDKAATAAAFAMAAHVTRIRHAEPWRRRTHRNPRLYRRLGPGNRKIHSACDGG